MLIEIGNPHAIETYYDDEGALAYRDLGKGQVTTHVSLPDDVSNTEAFNTICALLARHIHPNARPAWIESPRPELNKLLAAHWPRVPKKEDHPAQVAPVIGKPATWGKTIDPAEEAA